MHISRQRFLSLLATAALATPAMAQQDFANVQIQTTRVSGNIYMLVGQGGNIGLSVGADGAFVVDDQFAPLTEKILAAIAAITPDPVKFVMNTHWHGDHTGGNENLGKAGALLVAHQNVRRRMNPEEFRSVIGRSTQAPPDALPVVTFTEQINLYWNGNRIHVIHVPNAHTDGDVIVHFMGPNVIHMGDTFFNGSYPFIDTNSGGGINGVIDAANEALSLADSETKIIPGHGALSDIDDLIGYRNMLEAVRDRVRKLRNDGLTEDQVVAAGVTADFDPTVNAARSEGFVRAVYQTLSN